ncbi:MAG: outer membrane lipoprotein-sorting protein [Treponema sp.]|nr:outer membrane lipoprotein-sorting protein [Treponema sp.]
MKKIVWFLGCLFAWVSALTGEISLADAKSLLQKAEDNTCFYDTDMKGDYQIVHDKPGEGRNLINAILYRRDSQKKWTILITGPEKDKGKGYLQFDSNIWFYDPADKRFTFSSARDKFQNTNANTSDFAPQLYVSDYSMESYEEVKLGKFDCVVFNLKAVSKNVAYPELKLWVSKGDGLMRKREDYSLSHQRLRTIAVPSYQKVRNTEKEYSIPVNMVIQDHLKGKKINDKMEYEKTVISISNVVFEPVEDLVYTKPYLETMSVR